MDYKFFSHPFCIATQINTARGQATGSEIPRNPLLLESYHFLLCPSSMEERGEDTSYSILGKQQKLDKALDSQIMINSLGNLYVC